MKASIIPSILSLTDEEIPKAVKLLQKRFNWLQIDVMDGQFVNEKRFSPIFVKNLKTTMKKEVHLMVQNPEKEVPKYLDAQSIIFHLEAANDPYALIRLIKKNKKKAGIAINPETRIEEVYHFLTILDKVLIMGVHPGKGGQAFIPSTLQKIKDVRKQNKNIIIEVDGGINKTNIKKIFKAGANDLVIGSALVNGDMEKNMQHLMRNLK